MSENHQIRGITVATKGLSFTVQDKKAAITRKILDDVNFIANPGQLLVIMGPSGCGKTTFLNAIAGRLREKSNSILDGEILYNGNPDKKVVKQISNYVMQADNLMEFLTVRETIYYASLLRLSEMSSQERIERADRIVQELGLTMCLDVIVGGSQKKGLSGGQKKRVSIAIELLDDPQLLFLDEPTSGLDSSLAYDTMKVLVDVAKTGRTVISTVHQPRSQTFALFDQLLLLTTGKVVYHGSANLAESYFESLGYPCPPEFNPADYYLDLISPENLMHEIDDDVSDVKNNTPLNHNDDAEENEKSKSFAAAAATATESGHSIERHTAKGRIVVSPEEILQFPIKFAGSEAGKNIWIAVEKEFERTEDNKLLDPAREGLGKFLHGPSIRFWFTSFWVLTRRSFLNSWRNPVASIVQFVVQITYGLIIGGIFFQMNRDGTDFDESSANARNFVGYLFFVAVQYAFSNMDSLLSFPQERAVFNRDTANDIYDPSAFFMAKMAADFLYQHTALVIFSILAYFMGGLGLSASQFFTFLLIGMCATFSSASYLYVVGTGISDMQAASIAAPIGATILLILTGFYLPDDAIPAWIAWFRYVVHLRYAFFAFVQNEFRPHVTIGQGEGQITSNRILDEIARIPRTLNIWQNIAVCFALGVAYRFLAFLLLKFLHRGIGVEQ